MIDPHPVTPATAVIIALTLGGWYALIELVRGAVWGTRQDLGCMSPEWVDNLRFRRPP